MRACQLTTAQLCRTISSFQAADSGTAFRSGAFRNPSFQEKGSSPTGGALQTAGSNAALETARFAAGAFQDTGSTAEASGPIDSATASALCSTACRTSRLRASRPRPLTTMTTTTTTTTSSRISFPKLIGSEHLERRQRTFPGAWNYIVNSLNFHTLCFMIGKGEYNQGLARLPALTTT